MWHGATVLLSSLPKTIQAEHIVEISYVQASYLVTVRTLLTFCYTEVLLSCGLYVRVCIVIYLVMLHSFVGYSASNVGIVLRYELVGYGRRNL